MNTWQEYQQARGKAVRSQKCPRCGVGPGEFCITTYRAFSVTNPRPDPDGQFTPRLTGLHAARWYAARAAGVMPAPYGAEDAS